MTHHRIGSQETPVGRLQTQLNAYLAAHPDVKVPGHAKKHLTVDGKLGKHTRDILAAVQHHQKSANQHVLGRRGTTPRTKQEGIRAPRTAANPRHQRVATDVRQPRSERPVAEAPVRRARAGRIDAASIPAASPNHGIRHITQPDSGSCKPTTTRMIQNAGGHVGRERVGPGENMRLTGETMRRFVNQVQTTGVMAGVRSRSPGGAIRGSENGHVICITGYAIVDQRGRAVSDDVARAAMARANGNWDHVNSALAAQGLHMRLSTQDPGTSGVGAQSYLDVGADGRMHRPALSGGRVSQGEYTVRYLMLD